MNPVITGMMSSDKSHGKNDECYLKKWMKVKGA